MHQVYGHGALDEMLRRPIFRRYYPFQAFKENQVQYTWREHVEEISRFPHHRLASMATFFLAVHKILLLQTAEY